jgi:acetate kinase
MSSEHTILTLNAGSSSLRFAVSSSAGARRVEGKFERIGRADSLLNLPGRPSRPTPASDHAACLPAIAAVLAEHTLPPPAAIAHRIVHGGPAHFEPARVTPDLLAELRAIQDFAPNHLPTAIALMEAARRQWPEPVQVACFDTAFHRDLPVAARLLPVPRRFARQGIRRYGFHGLSFTSVLGRLRRESGGTLPRRLVLAHLGHGASMAAVLDGRSIDTTMGFTPAGGLVMSTRAGDLDPGLLGFLANREKLDGRGLERLVSAESGLLGLSETSSDTRDLLAREASDPQAAEALAVFVHQARKHLGALAAVLDGLDAVTFSGGIGENSSVLRARICAGFSHLGLQLDPAANEAHRPVISHRTSAVTVRILAADEESVLAAAARDLLASSSAA